MGGGRTGRRTCPALPRRTSRGKTGDNTDKTVRIIECDNLRIWANRKQFSLSKYHFRQNTGNRVTQSQRLWGEISRSMLVRLQPANQWKRWDRKARGCGAVG